MTITRTDGPKMLHNATERGGGPESSPADIPHHALSRWQINGLTGVSACATVKPDLRFRFLMV
jgi:hypothetical protein